jgi:hypothetical protein
MNGFLEITLPGSIVTSQTARNHAQARKRVGPPFPSVKAYFSGRIKHASLTDWQSAVAMCSSVCSADVFPNCWHYLVRSRPRPEEKAPHALQVKFPRLLDEALTHIPRLLDKYLKAIHFLWHNGQNQNCSNGKNRHGKSFRIQ